MSHTTGQHAEQNKQKDKTENKKEGEEKSLAGLLLKLSVPTDVSSVAFWGEVLHGMDAEVSGSVVNMGRVVDTADYFSESSTPKKKERGKETDRAREGKEDEKKKLIVKVRAELREDPEKRKAAQNLLERLMKEQGKREMQMRTREAIQEKEHASVVSIEKLIGSFNPKKSQITANPSTQTKAA
ncbi:MAG: hypothetical protein Q7S16_01910 [bacterium]|nr:hypothetical protein [bacterium]